jgi:uncharacterized protein YjiS (DUF1127 family)
MNRSSTLISLAAFEAATRDGGGTIVTSMFRAIGTSARRALERYRQRRKAWATYEALRHLDDHMLRDLGFDRSEITSVAAEVSGAATRTRVRVLLMSHSPP